MLRCIFCAILSSMVFMMMIQLTHGQTKKGKKIVRKKIIYKEKSYYSFEDTLVNGNLREPDGSFIFRKSESEFQSALGLKRSFIPELKESGKAVR